MTAAVSETLAWVVLYVVGAALVLFLAYIAVMVFRDGGNCPCGDCRRRRERAATLRGRPS